MKFNKKKVVFLSVLLFLIFTSPVYAANVIEPVVPPTLELIEYSPDSCFYGSGDSLTFKLKVENKPEDMNKYYFRIQYDCWKIDASSSSGLSIMSPITDVEKDTVSTTSMYSSGGFVYDEENDIYTITLTISDSNSNVKMRINKIKLIYSSWDSIDCDTGGINYIFSDDCKNNVHTILTTSESSVDKQPTCVENGAQSKKCIICKSIVEETVEEIPANGHTEVIDAGVEATCTKIGLTEGSHCAVCNAVIKEQKIVETKRHNYKTTITKATLKKNGSKVKKCIDCGDVATKTIIYSPKTIKLVASEYVYNGKAKTPAVAVKDTKGKTITSRDYIIVSYASGRKNVGIYKMTIRFTNDYSGSKSLTFTIKPKATTISKVTADKKEFTVKWKKQAIQTTGYQVQYSTNKYFEKATTKTISKNKITSLKVTKLKGGKKYYVRIRAYKSVKVSGKSTKIYSNWSKTTSVTTKR